MPERFLYILGAMSAMGPLRPGDTTDEEVRQDLIRIWDEQMYTPDDAVDFGTMSDRLKPHLTRYIVNDPLASLPESPPREKRQ